MNTQNKSILFTPLKNDILLEYANKLERLWECREEFFKVFITGIHDNEVRNRINIWYYQQQDQQANPDIFTIIKVARQFQKEKDEDDKMSLPDFKTKDDISRYFENEEQSESNICPPKIIFLFNL